MEHARFSPSAAYRWLNCPGSITLSDIIEPSETSRYAAQGTLAHEIADKEIKSRTFDCSGWINTKHTVNGHKLIFTEEDYHSVQMYLDYISMSVDLMKAKIISESKVSIDKTLKDCWGTRDLLLKNKKLISISDYKHGAGQFVEVENNPQLMIYLLGTYYDYPKFKGDFEINIVQPRCRKPHIRTQKISKDELMAFKDELVEYVTNYDPYKFETGDHCKWCQGKAICPQQQFDYLKILIEFIREKKTENCENIQLKRLAWILNKSDQIIEFINEVKEYAHTQATAYKQDIPGYKLVRGRSVRKWRYDKSDIEKILKRKAKKLGLKAKEIYNKKLKGLGDLEKLFSKEEIEKLTDKPEGDLILVPESDKRSVANAFDDFTTLEI